METSGDVCEEEVRKKCRMEELARSVAVEEETVDLVRHVLYVMFFVSSAVFKIICFWKVFFVFVRTNGSLSRHGSVSVSTYCDANWP